MTRFLAILAALTCAASAQTYRTVTADTNNVIRTNFSLTRSQVSDLTGATFAISNVTGLQSALDAKLATNGSAAGLTNFPSNLLTTNGDASGLTNFPPSLLTTNGDGSSLTNLPNADLTNATGILPIANGGTGTNSAAGARTALELGTAATNDATAFQPASTNLTALASGDGSSLTNVTITDASTLTNFPSELLRTNGDGSGLSGVAVYPALSNNAGLVLAVTTNETGVEWIAVSNTVTDASTLTNFPASILQTNSADGSFPVFLARTNADASGFTNFPTLNQNTTGTASNVTGIVQITNGGTGTNTAAGARINLLPSYTGNSNKVLAVNAGETDLEWVAGGGLPETPLSVTNGGTGATNASGALSNFNILRSNNAVGIGNDISATATNTLAIGYNSDATAASAIALGNAAVASGIREIAIGDQVGNGGSNSISIGYLVQGGANAVAIGASLTEATVDGVAIGKTAKAKATNSIAIGDNAEISTSATSSVAIGASAESVVPSAVALGVSAIVGAGGTNSVQLGNGINFDANTIQFRGAGTVDTNEWARIAALSTYPTTNISVVGTNNTNTLVFSNGILVEVQ